MYRYLGKTSKYAETGCLTGVAALAGAESAVAEGTAARVWNHGADRGPFGRSAARGGRVALSGPVPDGGGRLDQGEVDHHGEQPAGASLRDHGEGEEGTGYGPRSLADRDGSGGPGARAGINAGGRNVLALASGECVPRRTRRSGIGRRAALPLRGASGRARARRPEPPSSRARSPAPHGEFAG